MCAIAQRGGSCVGSLYQFFPNKEALVEALRTTYVEEHRRFWSSLRTELPGLSVQQLVEHLLGYPIAFATKHPAFLPLLDLPPSDRSQKRRALIRDRIAEALHTARPALSRAKAMRAAAVVQQITRGCLVLYARTEARDRRAIVDEFKIALGSYLRAALGE